MNAPFRASKSAAEILRDCGITTSSSTAGRQYVVCPQCSHKRKLANQKLPCLGVTIDHDGVKAGCNHCGWTGGGFYRAIERSAPAAAIDLAALERAKVKAAERQRIAIGDSQTKVKWLWAQRQPIEATVRTYLQDVRRYTGPLPPTLGFLPATDIYPPAMIAAFGMARETEPGRLVIDDAAVTGIHLTKLKPDGSGKAGIEGEPDKVTIGQGNSSPIWLAPVNDGLGLVIAEGIEDALSAHQATGLGAWAAGTAGRLPAMADFVPDYIESVTVMVDDDENGRKNSNELAQRLAERGIEVLMVRPGGFA
jgi:hypothetical protein